MFSIGGSFGTNEIPLFEMSKRYPMPHKNSAEEQCLEGSFTGEVDSYNATELHNGWLTLDGNQGDSVKAKASLTARPTSRAGGKPGLNDPPMPSGRHGA